MSTHPNHDDRAAYRRAVIRGTLLDGGFWAIALLGSTGFVYGFRILAAISRTMGGEMSA